MKKVYITLFIAIILSCNSEMVEDENLLENILKNDKESFGAILDNLEKNELQIIYTQINRDSTNTPSFKSFYFNVDSNRYFYPASTVKMPTAFLALEKLQALEIAALNMNTTFLTDSAYSGQTSVLEDSTSENGVPSIAHYIKKIFVVSDNDAYNRLYEFMGQEELNAALKAKGYTNTRIIHRLSIPLSLDENQHTNPIRFIDNDTVVYEQPLIKSKLNYNPKSTILKGIAHINKSDSLVNTPFDFTYKNFMPLEEMQQMLRSMIFPNPGAGFELSPDHRNFVMQYMSQLPRETSHPKYDGTEYYDAYSKFLMFGNSRNIPNNIRIFNKIGQAYGYMIDNAYIVDFDSNVEFFLSVVIHVNENNTYNDGQYEYEEVGYPFMQRLGEALHAYELKRKRSVRPDLSDFKLKYDK